SAIAAASLVALAGEPPDHAEHLPGIAAGTTIGTVALLEPGRRAAWRTPSTHATPVRGQWRVDGTKVHVPDVAIADLVLVSAVDPDGALGVFVITPGAAGVHLSAAPTVDG